MELHKIFGDIPTGSAGFTHASAAHYRLLDTLPLLDYDFKDQRSGMEVVLHLSISAMSLFALFGCKLFSKPPD